MTTNKFEQKEYDRINQGRNKSKQIMDENNNILRMKKNEYYTMQRQDKDMFNRQALEDKLHAEKTAEEKRKWTEWQKESLKNDYEESLKRKQAMSQMDRIKDKAYASQFKSSVETYEKNHNQALENLRKRNNALMDHQQRQIIPDLNSRRKNAAVNDMNKQFERTEKETLMKELNRLNKRNYEAKEISNTQRMQINNRKREFQSQAMENENYKKFVDNTVTLLSERDRKVAEERAKFRQSYAKDLENQIKEHIEKEKRVYNEMDERSQKLNQRGLAAYETGEINTGLFNLPGINREPINSREYFGRYTKKKQSSKAGSIRGLSQRGVLSERFNKELPTTSEDYLSRRRSSRGVYSPKSSSTNILGQEQNNNIGLGIEKYKSVANLHSPIKSNIPNIVKPEEKQQDQNEINVLSRKSTTMLSPRNNDNLEYKPTERDETARRNMPAAEVRPPSPQKINEEIKKQQPLNSPIKTVSPLRTSRGKTGREAPASLMDIDNKLNQKVLGSMRSGGNFLSGYNSSMN